MTPYGSLKPTRLFTEKKMLLLQSIYIWIIMNGAVLLVGNIPVKTILLSSNFTAKLIDCKAKLLQILLQ